MMQNIWAIVPAKAFGAAKSRLAALLTPGQREELSQAMLSDVFSALSKTPGLNGVLVVTNDPGGVAMAHGFGFRVLHDRDATGPTRAIDNALRDLENRACTGVLALMGDLPLITGDDIARLLSGHSGGRAVTLAPSLDRRGTNAAFCTPPGIIPLTFNGRGFSDHLKQARRAGLETNVVDLPGVALDLDQPEDIVTLIDTPSACRTRAFILDLVRAGQIPGFHANRKTG